jgi:transposase
MPVRQSRTGCVACRRTGLAWSTRSVINGAVADLTLPCRNGPIECVNAKTKRIKRQMHGRAGIPVIHDGRTLKFRPWQEVAG